MVALAVGGCIADPPPEQPGNPTEQPFVELLDLFLGAQDRASRERYLGFALDELGDGPADQLACSRTEALAEVGVRLDEVLARRLVRLIGAMQCDEGFAVLESVVHARWLARTGLTRASALELLCRGARLEVWDSEAVDALAQDASRDSSDLVRASAFEWILRDPERAGWGAAHLRASSDQSPWVRGIVEGDALEGAR
jgi:hypothetical protein